MAAGSDDASDPAMTEELHTKIPTGTVGLLRELNALVRWVREGAEDGVRVSGHRDPHTVCRHSAARATDSMVFGDSVAGGDPMASRDSDGLPGPHGSRRCPGVAAPKPPTATA